MSNLKPFTGELDTPSSTTPSSHLQPFNGALDSEKPKRSLKAALNDTVIEAANAAAGTASAVANFVRPGNVASQWIDKNIIEAGEAAQSDVVKAEKARYAQEMQQAQGIGDEVSATLGYAARNPLLAAAQAAGSFAVPGLGVSKAKALAGVAGLGAKGASRVGLAAGAGIGAAAAGGDAAGTAYELSREGGATDEQAVAAARGASLIPAAIGGAGGLVGAERLVAGARGFSGGLVTRALKTGAVEGAQEAIEEGVTQYEGQRAAVPFNSDLDPSKGVAGAATLGAVLGGTTGAGTSLLTRQNHSEARKPSEDLGLNPDNGPMSKVAAAAVDEGRAAVGAPTVQSDDGLRIQHEEPVQAQGPTLEERLDALPQQLRHQADGLLREIADERTPAGVKRFRANELQQLLDANPIAAEEPTSSGQSSDVHPTPEQPINPLLEGATGSDMAPPNVQGLEQLQQGVQTPAVSELAAADALHAPAEPLALSNASQPGQNYGATTSIHDEPQTDAPLQTQGQALAPVASQAVEGVDAAPIQQVQPQTEQEFASQTADVATDSVAQNDSVATASVEQAAQQIDEPAQPIFSPKASDDLTQSRAFKDWYGEWQNLRHVQEQLEPHRGRAQTPSDRGGALVNELQRPSGVDQDATDANPVRRITFSGTSGPTGADGAPVRLYHGTKDDVTAFDLSHPGRKDEGWLGDGVYLTSNQGDADHYSRAKQGEHGPNVMPLYANVRNPYEASKADKERFKHVSKSVIKAFTDDLKARGHDGVVLWDEDGDMELVAFEPTQVKSAIGNNGNFDGTNPDTRFSRSSKAVTKAEAVKLRRAMVQRTVNSLSKSWAQAPNIIIVDSMQDAQVPDSVRAADALQRSQGAQGEPEGFWHEGKVYLVANALSTSADAARVLYHEVLGHHGLKGFFGPDLDKVLVQVAKMRPKDLKAKAIAYGLDLSDPDHVTYAAEEVLAEMAQTRPDIGFVQRAIAAIRNFLRTHVPGFSTLELSDADIIQGYLLPARRWVESGTRLSEGNGAARDALVFARHPDFSAAVDAAIKAGQRGEASKGEHIEIASLPKALAVAGIPDGPLKTSAKVVQKVVFDHGVTPSTLKRIPELLESPVMVFHSASVGGRFVVVTSEMVRGSPLIVAISPETTRGNVALNFVPSLYPRDDLQAIQRWLNFTKPGEQLLTYLDKKQSPAWFGSTGLQLPSEYRTTQGLQRRNIATQADVVNDGESDNPMFSRAQPADDIRSSMGVMTPEQERAYKAVAGLQQAPTVKDRVQRFKANLGLRMKQALVDQFAPIAELDQHAYMMARMSKASDGTLEAALLYGKPFLRDGVPDVDIKDGGFAKILASLKGEHDRFLMWVAALRAESLKTQGKENLFSDQDISSLKTLNDGHMQNGSSRKETYAKALMQLNSFNESVLRMAKESGLIDQDAYDLMRDQPYVPFYRLMEEEGGLQGPSFSKGLTNQKAWKKLKGGTEQLNADLLQNLLLNWGNLYAASARNRAALATMDAAEKMAVAYKVPSDTKGAAKVMRDGMVEHWMVEDPYLLEAISALHYQASPFMKPLAKAKQWLTWGVTVNPTFKIRNLIRDVVSSMAMADLSYNPAANVAQGWKLTARDSQVYASMLAAGGVIKFGTQEQTDRARKQVAKLSGVMLDQSGSQKLWRQMRELYDVYAEFGDRTENVNRAALYERLIQKGHSHAEASFMARDLMDFSMGGNAPVVRFLTQSVPFLNARMQGLYKLGRAAKQDPRRFATVAMAVSVASLGLLAAYADDEDWKRREDWDRDSYWWFKIGETAYRIPKPFEVGAIGTLAERTAEVMFSEEMDNKRFLERISHMVSQTFALDPIPQAVKPLLDIYANKDSFTGRAIESQADQRLRPQDRMNERTSEVARFLGQLGLPDPAQLVKGEYTQLSPKQIDHLLRGYFSWMATAATTVSDYPLRWAADRGERPDMRLKDAFLAGNFVESLPTGSSRYVSALYEQSRQVEQAYASYREALASGGSAKAAEIMESDGDRIRNRATIAAATKQLSNLSALAKRIEADRNLDAAQKREQLSRIEQRRHAIAQLAVSRVAVSG